METALLCLLLFAAWTLGVVLLGIGPYRVSRVLLRKAPPKGFPGDVPHGPDLYRRLMRAHANCVENLPVFGAVVLIAALTHRTANPWPAANVSCFATLAIVYVCARAGQTLTHIASGSNIAINIRFTFFLTQVAIVVWMGLLVAQNL